MDAIAIKNSIQLLRKASTEQGILASTENLANYRRIWARDGIVCGLAGLLLEDEIIIASFKETLLKLAVCIGPHGQIPSNILIDESGNIEDISYGGIVGRVDTIPWFVIGVCNYVDFTGDWKFAEKMHSKIKNGLQLLEAWEFNSKGLIYVPQSGDWADEYIFHGYILYDQLLRLWAVKCFQKIFDERAGIKDLHELKNLIKLNFCPKTANKNSKQLFQPRAFIKVLEKQPEVQYFLPSITPGGYFLQFDALSNALAILLNLPDKKQLSDMLNFGQSLISKNILKMMPCYWPPINESDFEWEQLQTNYRDQFRNKPHQYHNGGVWPVINGWWGMALHKAGKKEEAEKLLNAIHSFNKLETNRGEEWGFYEYGNSKTGEVGGVKHLSWSAAGALLLSEKLKGKNLFFA